MFLRIVLHSSDGQLLNKGLHLWTSLTKSRPINIHITVIVTVIAKGGREVVRSGERATILVVLPLDGVWEFFPCAACSIAQIKADARFDDGNLEQQRLVLASEVTAEEAMCLRLNK